MKKIISLLILGVLSAGFFMGATAFAVSEKETATLDIKSKAAYLVDYESGTVLFEYKQDDKRPIASMVKIMTLLLCLEKVDSGDLDVNSEIVVSQNAASMGGSQAFLDANQSYKIDDLLKTITIASANDSCVAMAEHISGSVEGFVDAMNARARELGMENTLFANCTGLPAPDQYSTAKDVSIMTRELLKHSSYFNYSRIWLDKLTHSGGRETELANTNKLVRAYEGCDGGKTGFTNDAMFCLSATAKRGSMRLISVILGGSDSKIRFAESAKLLNYGFANFENKQVVAKGSQASAKCEVVRGKQSEVELVADKDFFVFGKKGSLKDSITTKEELFGLKAPVKEGDIGGSITVFVDGNEVGRVNLVSKDSSSRKGFNDYLNEVFDRLANVA